MNACKLGWTIPVLVAARICGAQCEARWFDTAEMGRPGVTGCDTTPSVYASTFWTPPRGDPSIPGLVVGGWFCRAGSRDTGNIAIFHEDTRTQLGTGTDPFISAVSPFGDDLYAGGSIRDAGGRSVWYLARWDGEAWHALPQEVNGQISALVQFEGKLVAAGNFTEAGGEPVWFIAAWNGTDWEPFGEGLEWSVSALAVHEGELYAAGDYAFGYDAYIITRWDGSTWQHVGEMSSAVHALASHDGGLVAAGEFHEVNGVARERIARWDGAAWHSFGGGANGAVYSLASHGDSLIAGGAFTAIDGVPGESIARWDGADWHAMDTGMANEDGAQPYVFSLSTRGPGALFACGAFTHASGRPVNNVARWDEANETWLPVSGGLSEGDLGDDVHDFLSTDDGLVLAGSFETAGSNLANNIALWTGRGYRPLRGGILGEVHDLIAFEGDVIAGGGFGVVDGQSMHAIARWDGEEWSPVGQGLDGSVFTMAVHNDRLVVGGVLQRNGQPGGVFRLNGDDWQPVGDDLDNRVHCLAVHEGDLIVGGVFNNSANRPLARIARLEGNQWMPIGGGLPGNGGGTVRALAIYGGELIAGGSFGTPAGKVARWNGSDWLPLGGGLTGGEVLDLHVRDGLLYAGGTFTAAEGQGTNGLAVWDGSSWSPVDAGANELVRSIGSHDRELVIGGPFTEVDGKATIHWARKTFDNIPSIAVQPREVAIEPGETARLAIRVASGYSIFNDSALRWRRNGVNVVNGAEGASQGGGIVTGANTEVLTITDAAESDSGSYRCRVLNHCGQTLSRAAELEVGGCPADFDDDGAVDTRDVIAFLNAWTDGDPAADFDGDGIVDTRDVLAFLNAWNAGC